MVFLYNCGVSFSRTVEVKIELNDYIRVLISNRDLMIIYLENKP